MLLMCGLTYSQATWIRVTSPVTTKLTSVSFSNERTGFITSGNKILKTTNGGFDWIVFDSSFTYALDKIQFVNQSTGYIVTPYDVRIYKTTNLGLNWNEAGLGTTFCFLDELRGWSNGYLGLQYTNNGGISWNFCNVPDYSGNISFGSPNFGVTTSYFHDFMHGWVYMYIYRSTDGVNFNCVPGGVVAYPCAWSKTPGGIGGTPPNELFNKVYLIDGSAGFLFYGFIKSNIYRTIDAGLTWSGPIGIGTSAANFDFIDHNTGYGAGTGTIIYTTNCGANWSNQNIGVTSQINDICMLNNTTGWACGDDGVILLSGVNPPAIPIAPSLLSPVDNSIGMPLIDTLIWERSVEGVFYQVQIAVDLGFNNIIVNDSNLTSSSRIINGLIPFTTYYWRVNTKNAGGSSNWSSVWRFKTKGYPTLINLAVPPNNAVNIPLNCTFYWSKAFDQLLKPAIKENNKYSSVLFLNDEAESIEKYWFELTTDTNSSNYFLLDSAITDTSRIVNNLNHSTVYFWRVKAKNEIGWGAFSGWFRFTTISGLPMQVILNYPPNNAFDQPVDINFNWYKAVEQVLSPNQRNTMKDNSPISLNSKTEDDLDAIAFYWFELTTDTATLAGLITDSTLTDTMKTVNGLSNVTIYLWRVKAKNETGWGEFSVWYRFTTIIGAPSAPFLQSPVNGSIGQNTELSLAWDYVIGASSYRLQVATDSLFTALVFNDSNITNLQNIVSGLNPLTFYWWRVNAKNISGTSAYSEVWKFKTIGLPEKVTLINPPNNAVNQPLSVNFSWSSAAEQMAPFEKTNKHFRINGVNDHIGLYCFDMVTDTVSLANLLTDSTLTDTTKTVYSLSYLTNYYWRVKAKGFLGWGAYSAWFKFTTIISVPAAPLLISPPDNSTGQDISLSLIWYKVPAAVTYRLQAASDSLFTVLIFNDSTITDTTSVISGLNPLTFYWWKVSAKNIGGTSAYSVTWKFKTIGVPEQVLLLDPPDNAINQPVNLTLTWRRSSELLAPWINKKISRGDENGSISKYWFDMVTDTVSMSNLLRDTTLIDTSKAISGLNYQTGYFWRVRAKNQVGWGSYSVWFKFTTMPLPPALLNLTVIPGGYFNTGTNRLNMKDTISVYLVDSATCLKVDSSKGVLDSVSFTLPLSFANAVTGNYYLLVYHRNHLGIATMFKQSIVRGASTSYDFIVDSASAFGFNMIKVSTSPVRWGMIPGDANRDGFVDAIDQIIWISQNGLDGYLSADFNGDGYVDAIDQTVFWVVYNGLSSFLPCGFTFDPGTQSLIKNVPNFYLKKSKTSLPEIKSQNNRIQNDKNPDNKKH